ncbi:MAG: SLC13 family permease, partial [Bryobacteraceae bacterium]
RVGWMSWFLAGIVPGLCSLALVPLAVYHLDKPKIRSTPEAAAFAMRELRAMGPMARREWLVLAVFLGACGAWMTERWHHLDITVTALLGACVLLVTGVLSWEEVKNERAAWDIFIWYGGLLMLGKALNAAGVTTAFAQAVGSAFGGVGWVRLLAIALPVYFYSHYAYASITAHMLAMYSPFLAVLAAQGAPPGLAVYAFACFTNLAAGLTHYGTTPAPMYFAHGYTSLGRWWKVGAAVSIVNLLVWSGVGFFWWKWIGVW